MASKSPVELPRQVWVSSAASTTLERLQQTRGWTYSDIASAGVAMFAELPIEDQARRIEAVRAALAGQ